MNLFTFYPQPFASIRTILLLLTVSFLFSCNNKDVVVDESLLTKYNSIAHPTVIANAVEDIDCYLDYSFGMGEGMKATSAINDKLKAN